jgi:hypothetical protein
MKFAHPEFSSVQAQRRKMLKLAALGAGASMLPLSLRLAAREKISAVAAGYWQGGAALNDVADVRRGWGEPCATAACEVVLSDSLVDATSVAGTAADYQVRLLGAEFDRALHVDAHYGGASHGFWSAWRRGDNVEGSASHSISWRSHGEALSFVVADGQRRSVVSVPARTGVYVVPLDADVEWHRLALAAPDAERPLALRLVARDASAKAPSYLLLSVQARTETANA